MLRLDEQVSHCNLKIQQVICSPPEEKAELVSLASEDQRQEQAPVSSTPVVVEPMRAQDPRPEDGPKVPLSFQQAVALLDSIPGINQRIAEIFIAEVGTDMQRFPTAQHLASWVGICPGNHQSAGKQLRGKGDRGTRQALIEAAEASYADQRHVLKRARTTAHPQTGQTASRDRCGSLDPDYCSSCPLPSAALSRSWESVL